MSQTEIAPVIQQKYAEHSALVAELATIDWIPHAHSANQNQIKTYKKELEKLKEQIAELEKKTHSEYKDIQKLQRSVSKRLLYRVTGSLEQKKLKEEQVYLDALQAEQNVKTRISALEIEIAELEKNGQELKSRDEKYTKARKRLDTLYQELFGGLTGDYPEEDAAENAMKDAEHGYAKAQEDLNRESQVHKLLAKADKEMVRVLERMNQAEDIALKELRGLANVHDFSQLHELVSAKKHAVEAETYVNQARLLDTRIPDFGQLSIPLQDNGTAYQYSDQSGELLVHKMILNANKTCIKYGVRLEVERDAAQNRVQAASNFAIERNVVLTAAREELEQLRRRIIEDVHKGVLPQHRGPFVFGGIGGGPSDMPSALPPSFPSAPPQPPHGNFPAGGFRSSQDGGIAMPTSPATDGPDGPKFPDSPEYQHPATTIAPTVPGFRGAGEAGVVASIAAITFPSAVPWALNPEAATSFFNAMAEASKEEEMKDEDFKMPQGPDQIVMPAVPDTPGFPPTPAPGSSAWVPTLKEGEEVLYKGRGKLFRFISDPTSPQWEHGSAGDIRLIADKKEKAVRVVWKDDKSPAVTTTHFIRSDMKLLPSIGTDRAFVWNVVASETLAIRFKDADAAKEFQTAFEKAQADALPPLVSSPVSEMPSSAISMPSTSSGDAPQMPISPADAAKNDAPPMPHPSVGGPMMPLSPADGVTLPQPGDGVQGITSSVAGLHIVKKNPTVPDNGPKP